MLTKFQNHLNSSGILPAKSKLVVAVSGGVDSVTLLHAINQMNRYYNWNIAVAHYDHKQRPDSHKDAELVGLLSESYGNRYYLNKHMDGIQSEAELRRARYKFLEQLRDDLGFDYIITAHHGDDRIETAVFNTIRGADRLGMASMKSKRDKLIRPLLPFSKAEIITYASLQNLAYNEDSTNTNIDFSRNFVRHELVPLGSMIYKNFHHSFTNKLNELDALNESIGSRLDILLDSLTLQKDERSITLDKNQYMQLPDNVALNLLIHILNKLKPGVGLSRKNIMQAERFILESEGRPGNLHIKAGLHIEIGYGTLKVTCQPETVNHFKNFSTHILTPEHPFSNDMFKLYIGDAQKDHVATLDIPEQKIIVRHRQTGDKISPQGMEGTKKLQDIFVDNKISRAHRDDWPLIVNDRNEILWVPFVVTDRRAQTTKNTSKKISIICEVNK